MIQDILEEEDMELDWDFRLSLINDIVKEQITLESSVTTLNRLFLFLKGQCHKGYFTNHLPQAPDNNVRVFSNFFQNSRRYSQLKVHHWYQRYKWQICRWCC
jgi:hypothetical protein